MKRHSWKNLEVNINDKYYKHKVCRNCDLHKAINNKNAKFRTTFYFELDTKGNIIYGGKNINIVPYGCGDRKPMSKFFLEDELFEI